MVGYLRNQMQQDNHSEMGAALRSRVATANLMAQTTIRRVPTKLVVSLFGSAGSFRSVFCSYSELFCLERSRGRMGGEIETLSRNSLYIINIV